jgi:von Willebrand factor type A domain/VWA / Hh  protein intein-like
MGFRRELKKATRKVERETKRVVRQGESIAHRRDAKNGHRAEREIAPCRADEPKHANESSHMNPPLRVLVPLEDTEMALEEQQPLKQLHDHLDGPEVETAMLSDVRLDAAKTNRCLQVLAIDADAVAEPATDATEETSATTTTLSGASQEIELEPWELDDLPGLNELTVARERVASAQLDLEALEQDMHIDYVPFDHSRSRDQGSLTLRGLSEVPAVAATERRTIRCLMEITAPRFRLERRVPVDLCIVVDRSGSMEGEPIELVMQTLEFVVTQLEPDDRLAVVSYGADVTDELALTAMDERGRALAAQRVREIRVAGCTNLSGGLLRAIEILRERDDCEDGPKNAVASILLLTDGLANEGYGNVRDIMRAARFPAQQWKSRARTTSSTGSSTRFDSRPPIHDASSRTVSCGDDGLTEAELALPGTINTFGFSARHDPKFLSDIAEAGGGMYHLIETPQAIADAFATCVAGLLSTTSQRLSLEVTATEGVTIRNILTRFRVREEDHALRYSVSVADMQSEETREVLLCFEVPEVTEPTDAFKVCASKLRYFNAIEDRDEVCEADTTISRPAERPVHQNVEKVVDISFNRAAAVEAMDAAARAGDVGDIELAKSLLSDGIGQIANSETAAEPFCLALAEDMKRVAAQLSTRSQYERSGRHQLYSNSACHGYQRATLSPGMKSQGRYTTTSRAISSDLKSAHFGAGAVL